jgi:hypothetical protein
MKPHRRTRHGIATAVLALLVCLMTLSPALSASADDSGSTGAGAKKSAVTVGIRTANAKGGDNRGAFDYEILPRGLVRDWVAVSNYGDKRVTVRLFGKDATSTPGASFEVQKSGEAPKDLGAWIALKKNKVTIPPRTEIVVPFQLGVPYNATPGDHAGAIVLSLLAKEPKPAGGTIVVDHRVGLRIHLRVPGDLKPSLAVEGLKVLWNGQGDLLGRGDAKVSYLVRNTGNVVMDVDSDIDLTRVLGLPSTDAMVPQIKELLPGGTARVERVVKNVFGTGPMKAQVTLHGVPTDPDLADRKVDVTKSAGLQAWPWVLIAIVVALMALLGTGGWYERRRRQHRRAQDAAKEAEERAAQARARHRLLARSALAGAMAVLAAGLVTLTGAPASASDGDTWKATISPKNGVAGEAFDVHTSGGCPLPATNIVGFGYGAGFPKDGAVVVSNTGPVDSGSGFTASIVDSMMGLMATQPNPQQLHGTYKFVIRCIQPEWPDRSYGEYVAAVKFDNPYKWHALPPLTQKKGPVVPQVAPGPDQGSDGSGQAQGDAQGGAQGGAPAGGTAGESGGTTGSRSAADRAQSLLDTGGKADASGSGPSWPLLGAGAAVAVVSLLIAFGSRIPRPRRRS